MTLNRPSGIFHLLPSQLRKLASLACLFDQPSGVEGLNKSTWH